MTLLNTADAIFLGSSTVDKVYLGDVQVWPLTITFTARVAVVGSIPWAVFVQTTGPRQETMAPGMVINE